MVEHRKAPRQKSLLQGRVYFNNRRSSIDCIVRDISATGAKLTFSSAVETPAVVELYIPNKDETRPARIVWRRGEDVGLTFISASESDLDLSARVERLEEEIKELRGALAELRKELKRPSV